MSKINLGERLRVRYTDGLRYVLWVQVMADCTPHEFFGKVETIFADPDEGGGEITGGRVRELIGADMKFRVQDVIP